MFQIYFYMYISYIYCTPLNNGLHIGIIRSQCHPLPPGNKTSSKGLLYNHHDPLHKSINRVLFRRSIHCLSTLSTLRMTDEGREPWSRYVDLLIQEIDRLAGAASEDDSCRQRTFFFWKVRSFLIGSMGLVYYLHSVDVFILFGGKCRYICHTWILWGEVVNYTLRILTPKFCA